MADIERKKVLQKLKKLEIQGLEDKDIVEMDNKTGFNNLNMGLNNLTTMMSEHNTRLEAILEK